MVEKQRHALLNRTDPSLQRLQAFLELRKLRT